MRYDAAEIIHKQSLSIDMCANMEDAKLLNYLRSFKKTWLKYF